MKILLNSWMREIDRAAITGRGIPAIVLMENAAVAGCDYFTEVFPRNRYPGCLVLAGKGNNGGDGLAIARLLLERGYGVRVLLMARPVELGPECQDQLRTPAGGGLRSRGGFIRGQPEKSPGRLRLPARPFWSMPCSAPGWTNR